MGQKSVLIQEIEVHSNSDLDNVNASIFFSFYNLRRAVVLFSPSVVPTLGFLNNKQCIHHSSHMLHTTFAVAYIPQEQPNITTFDKSLVSNKYRNDCSKVHQYCIRENC